MAEHTPGPWKVGAPDVDLDTEIRWIDAESTTHDGQSIAEVFGRKATDKSDGAEWCPESEANARLIAAAPELLEALKGVLPAFWNDSTQTIARVYQARIEAAEAAIAKAEGK